MKLLIYQPGGITIDATNLLFQGEEPELDQEMERDRWEWMTDTIGMVLSDKDRTFTQAFNGITKQTKWWVDLYGDTYDSTSGMFVPSTRLLFQGLIDTPTLKLVPLRRTASFTSYPLDRFLWDKLATIKVRRTMAPGDGGFLIPMPMFLHRELVTIHGADTDNFIGRVLMDQEWYTRMVRDSGVDPSGTYQNAARFDLIDPDMTWAQLLQEMSIYYNVAFVIDKETRTLTVRRRTDTTSEAVRTVDDFICQEEDVEVYPIDDKQIDYAGTYMQMQIPAPTITNQQSYWEQDFPINTIRLPGGTVGWAITATVDGQEIFTSAPLVVKLLEWRALGQVLTWAITLKIGPGPAGTEKRALYRYHGSTAHLGYRKMKVFDGNTPLDYTDEMPLHPWIVDADILPVNSNHAKAWMKFDPATGWGAPVLDPTGSNTPPGTTLDIIPKIQFTDPASEDTLLQLDGKRVFDFFGGEMTPAQFITQYEDLFYTRQRVTCKLKGTDYRLGDRLRFNKVEGIQGRELVVKKAKNLIFQRKTQLELLAK